MNFKAALRVLLGAAEQARLFAPRPYLPIVVYDPAFASWQNARRRAVFERMREAAR